MAYPWAIRWRVLCQQLLALGRAWGSQVPCVTHETLVLMPGKMQDLGLCVVTRPKRRLSPGAIWLQRVGSRTVDSRVAPAVMAAPWEYETFLWIHWPTFLRALDPVRSTTVATHSLRTWGMLVDLVSEYNSLAARDLDVAAHTSRNDSNARSRFMTQYEQILQAPRFLARAWHGLEDSMESLVEPTVHKHLMASLSVPKHNGTQWPGGSTLLRLTNEPIRRLVWRGIKAEPARPAATPVQRIIEDVAFANAVHGVVPVRAAPCDGKLRLVDLSVMGLAAMERDENNTILALMQTAKEDPWRGGAMIAEAFLRAGGDKHLGRSPRPLEDLVRQAGWPWRPDEATPYLVLRLPTTTELTEVHKRRRELGAIRRRTRGLHARWSVREVRLRWVNPLDASEHTVPVIMRRLRRRSVHDKACAVASVPQTPLVLCPMLATDLIKERVPDSVRVMSRGRPFWSVEGLEWRLRKLVAKDPRRAAVSAFLDWWRIEAITITDERFKRMIYDERLSKRQVAVVKGERKTLGRFTAQEAEALRGFCMNRGRNGIVTEDEWALLSTLLPLRTQTALLHQIHRLGEDYARRFGSVAWRQSGFFVRHSDKRLKRFRSKGIAYAKKGPTDGRSSV